MKKLLYSVMTIGIAAAMLGAGTFAYFSDVETSTGNTFTAGTIDIQVNDADDPLPVLVSFADVKPCEVKLVTITITNVGNNPVDVWKHITSVVCDQGTDTEPELAEEATGGPKYDIDKYILYDLTVDGVEKITEADLQYITPDIASYYMYLGTIAPGGSMTVEQSYHLVETVTNWAQGDTMSFTIEFVAQQTVGGISPPSPQHSIAQKV